jgi:hypothetical protein
MAGKSKQNKSGSEPHINKPKSGPSAKNNDPVGEPQIDKPRVGSPTKNNDPADGVESELKSLLQRAEKGDPSSIAALREVLDHNPDIWKHYGDLGLHAEGLLIQRISSTNLLMAESLARRLHSLKTELAGPGPGYLEKLLVDRVAACWLQTSYFDLVIAQSEGATPRHMQDLQRRQDRAHGRYLAALKALDTMRRHLKQSPIPAPVPTRRRP